MADNPIYDFLKKNKLTDKDEKSFLTDYSDTTKAKELYGFFQSNKLTDKDFDSFYGEYLKKKDIATDSGNGLSPLGSGSNPFQSSQAPIAPTVLTPKNQEQYVQKQKSERQLLSDQLNNAQNAFRASQGDDLANEVQSIQPEQSVVREPEKDPTFTESVANTGSNIVTGLKQFIPNTAIAVTDGLTQVLGKDLGGDVYAQLTRGGNVDMQRSEAYQALADLEPQFKHTRGLIESGQKFDVPGLAAATIDAVGSLVRTAVTSIPTAGFGLYSDMVGSSVANYNKQKAKSLGVTVDELYGKGENDYFVPATIGAVGAQMEKIGLKGVQSAINKQLTGSATKKMALLFNDVNKEGLTEWLQTGLEKGNTALGSGKGAIDAGEEAVSEMFSKKGLEAYLMGVVGSGGAAGLGRIARGMTNPKNKAKVEEDVATINRFTEEIVNPDASPATKAFVEKQIRSKVADVANTIDEDVESVEKFGAEQKQVIQDLQGQIAQAEEVTLDPALTPETKVLAEEEVKTLNKELETALKEKPKLTDKDAVIEEESKEVIENGIKGLEKEVEKKLKEKPKVEESISETITEEGGQDAVQEQFSETSLLRTEQPEVGLQGVGQGVQQVTETPNETVTEEVQVSEKEEISEQENQTQDTDTRPVEATGSPRAVGEATNQAEAEEVAPKVKPTTIEAEVLEAPELVSKAGFELGVVETPSGKFRIVETNSKKPVGKLYDTKEELIVDYNDNKDKITVERLSEVTGVKPKEVVEPVSKPKEPVKNDTVEKHKNSKKYNSEIEVGQRYYDSRYGDSYTIEELTPVEGGDVNATLKYDKGKTRTESGDFMLYHIDAKQHSLINEPSQSKPQPEKENKQSDKFYIKDGKDFLEQENAKPVKLDAEGDFFSTKQENGSYIIVDGKSGVPVDANSFHKTIKDAIEDANKRIGLSPVPFDKMVEGIIERDGVSPRYAKENVPLTDKVDNSKTTVKEPVTELKEERDKWTESKDLNRIFADAKKKYGEKDGSKYNDVVNRLVNPNENTIIEVRANGVVVKEDGKYLLKPFTNTDANYKKWQLARPLDVTDQYVTTKSEPTKLQTAKEKLAEAKAKLDALNKNLGIASDPEQKAKALFEYHKALVNVAKEYISEGISNVQDFAKEIGEKVNKVVQDAWDEANGGAKKTLSDFVSEPESKTDVSPEFEQLVAKNINSDEVSQTLNNVERETGRELTKEEKDYYVTKRVEALAHGTDVVEQAKLEFGNTYVNDLLNYLNENANKISIENKSLITIALELDLERQIQEEPENVLTLEKQLKRVRDISTKQQRSAAIATGYGILRQIARVGYDVNLVTDEFFSAKQLEGRRKITKAIESDADAINQEAEDLEVEIAETEDNFLDEDIQRLIEEGVEAELAKLKVTMPTKRRQQADKAIAAIDKFQKKLKGLTYDATVGVPVAIINGGLSTIKVAIDKGVNVADAIELGIKKIKRDYNKQWDKEGKFRKDMLDFFKKEGVELKEGKRVLSDEQKRKMYVKRLEKDLEDLDAQIEAKKRTVVEKQDKYKNDAEIQKLRETRDAKQELLNQVDPSYIENVKLKNDLNSAQKSLEEYERRVKENDFGSSKVPTEGEINEKLKELREKRDKVKQEYQDKKKAYEQSLSQTVAKQPSTPKGRLEQAKERVKERIEALQQEIADKRKELKVQNKLTPDTELESLLEQEKSLKEVARTYLTQDAIDRINESKEKAVITRLENEVKDLDAQIAKGEKDAREAKTPLTTPAITRLKAEKQVKMSVLESLDPNPKEFTKQALIDAGYGREINVKTKNGKEKRQVIDWKKLAGEEGSIENIEAIVEKSLKDKGFSEAQIIRMKGAFVSEYNNLRASIIEKSLTELNRLNTPKEPVIPRSSARRLAELYDLGLFDKDSDTYDYLMNKAVGLSDIGQKAFFEAKKLAQALSDLYKRPILGNKIQNNEFLIKSAVSSINQHITQLRNVVSFDESNINYKIARVAEQWMSLAQRAMLNSIKQLVENPMSASVKRMINRLSDIRKKNDTAELKRQRKEISYVVIKDIVSNGGMVYGDVSSPFITRNQVEDWVNRQSDNKLYHIAWSSIIGKNFLEGADSMHKAAMTEINFKNALLTVLTDKNNPNKMSKDDALKFVSEQLTGLKFDEAYQEAGNIIADTNAKYGKEILKDNPENIYRLAMDLVKASLLEGDKITLEQIEKSYNAAYKMAGFDLGHEYNNPVSKMISESSGSIENEVERAVKDKEWNRASALIYGKIFFSNMLNPFVGGGTNWAFIGAQLSGLDFVSPIVWYRNRIKDIDISTPEGMKNLEKKLYQDYRFKSTTANYLIGAGAGALFTAAMIASGADDEYDKWMKQNAFLKKYLNVVNPKVYTLAMAYQNGELGKHLTNLFLRSRQFDSESDLVLGLGELNKAKTQAEKDLAWGKVGKATGSYFGTPIIPYRVMRDAFDLKDGFSGRPPRKFDFENVGFANGYFNYGFVEFIGLRPEKTFSRDVENVIPSKDKATLDFLSKNKLTIASDSDKEFVIKGGVRGLSLDEASKYDKEWGKAFYEQLKGEQKELEELPEKELTKRINEMKSFSTESTLMKMGAYKESITEFTVDGVTYVLDAEQLGERQKMLDKAKRPNLTPSRKKQIDEANSDFEKSMLKRKFALTDAMEDSKDRLFKKYKGRLTVKQ